MKRMISFLTFILVLISLFYPQNSSAQSAPTGRFELITTTIRIGLDTRSPAMIVDVYQGVIWTCQDVQIANPAWIKSDLGQNGDNRLTQKRYIGQMLQWQAPEFRMPALVLDTETGIVWNSPNIMAPAPIWTRQELR